MAISRPPKRAQETPVPTAAVASKEPTEAQIRAVIKKGGSVASEGFQATASTQDVKRGFELRLYQSMIDEIEEARNQVTKGKKPSRNTWIVSAIQEKLERGK